MNTLSLILPPLVGAFIGWSAIALAIHMLFHPREPKRILGICVQGVLPKSQKQLANKLGSTVASKVFNIKDIAAQMSDPSALANVMPGIEGHIDQFLQVRLKEKIPVAAMFLSDAMLGQIKTGLIEEIQSMLPQVIGQYVSTLEQKINIEKMVADKVAAISTERLEASLMSSMAKELRMVKLLGAGLGFVIGLVQLAISLI